MHGVIRERLEDYLQGGPASPELQKHLQTCDQCREELNWMQEQAQMLHALAPARTTDPAPGFYARVMERIETRQTPSLWDFFLEPAFGRRILATSLTLLCLLGGYLAFNEAESQAPASSAEAIMAVPEHPAGLGVNVQRDRDTVLFSLATYRSE